LLDLIIAGATEFLANHALQNNTNRTVSTMGRSWVWPLERRRN